MTTPLYVTFEKRIRDATEQLLRKQVEPWAFLNSGRPFQVKTFDGRTISYEGVGFEGSPRQVFWSRYMEPFLEHLIVQEIAAATSAARERKVDAGLLLPEVQGLLIAACSKIFSRMAQTDQRLLGRGHPQSIPLRPIESELVRMKDFIEKHISSELQMWKPRPWYEEWYEQNKFLAWAIGTVLAIAGLAAKFL